MLASCLNFTLTSPLVSLPHAGHIASAKRGKTTRPVTGLIATASQPHGPTASQPHSLTASQDQLGLLAKMKLHRDYMVGVWALAGIVIPFD